MLTDFQNSLATDSAVNFRQSSN